MSNVIDILEQRGLIADTTSEGIRGWLEKPRAIYCGFDPTATSLHLGNLMGIIMLRWFQRCGHRPIVVLGGATGLIGDPSGKSEERLLLTQETVQENIRSIRGNFERTLPSDAGMCAAEFVNNYDWYSKMNAIEFLRDLGKAFRVGPMLAKESVRARLSSDTGMSYTEFSYQLLQGYDFYHLYKEKGVSIECGGSDQWGNITAGIDFIRKKGIADEVYGLTFPLLTTADGKKFGKSEGGALWLDPRMCTPYRFYQHLYSTTDADVIRLLKALTFLSLDEIHEIEAAIAAAPNAAQRRLAEEVTRYVHGEEGLTLALHASEILKPGSKAELSKELLLQVEESIPSVRGLELVGVPIDTLLAEAKAVSSKSEVARLVSNRGLYLNNSLVEDPKRKITTEDLIEQELILVSLGKKKKMLFFT